MYFHASNVTCPQCGEMATEPTLWKGWVCPGCRARIAMPRPRVAVGVGLVLAGIATLIFARSPSWAPLADSAVIAAGGVVLASARPRVVARGPFCLGCGYDMGSIDGVERCPECGRLVGSVRPVQARE